MPAPVDQIDPWIWCDNLPDPCPMYQVRCTNPMDWPAERFMCGECFRPCSPCGPPPPDPKVTGLIESIDPDTFVRGQDCHMTITGQYFTDQWPTMVDSRTGSEVGFPFRTVLSATSMTAWFTAEQSEQLTSPADIYLSTSQPLWLDSNRVPITLTDPD